MSDDNVRLSRAELVRWSVLALVLAGALLSYFVLSRRVPPAIPVIHEEAATTP
jgi:hypothetical protein